MVREQRKGNTTSLQSTISTECFSFSQALLEPYTHISSVPGKDIRGQMIAAFNAWLQVPEDKLITISRVISMLHNASLLYVHHYRWLPSLPIIVVWMTSKMMPSCAEAFQVSYEMKICMWNGWSRIVSHKIYGIPQTINSANYAYFLAYQQLFALRADVETMVVQPESVKRVIEHTEMDKVVTGGSKVFSSTSTVMFWR